MKETYRNTPGGRYLAKPLEFTRTFVLKVESKSSSALRRDGGGRQEVTSDVCRRAPGLHSGVLPVVEQDVRRPDLIRGEAEVFHSRVFALVPLEVVVKPTL